MYRSSVPDVSPRAQLLLYLTETAEADYRKLENPTERRDEYVTRTVRETLKELEKVLAK